MVPAPDKTMIDQLLEEQGMLTAVTRFAQKHEREQVPVQRRYYRDLLPLNKPKPGEQYNFEVDLDKCSGCKACVTACHSLNGLEEEESWRTVGLLVGSDPEAPFQQTVTTACHHCVEPACSDGCPVLAYEKDAETGIVQHLDDQCIGCQYCVMKCPYEVPRYSARLGIVRKCDMCSNRLAAGEAPACVQSCPSRAIRITVAGQEDLRRDYSAECEENPFLPASPLPGYTLPSTRYVSGRGLPRGLAAGDAADVSPAEPHWPLIWMLLLTQAGVGGLMANLMLAALFEEALGSRTVSIVGALFGVCGLVASIFHLGRPLQAWKAFLNLRRSWLSREIVAFGCFGTVAGGVLVVEVCSLFGAGHRIVSLLLPLAVLTGMIGVFTSVMVYHDTRREFWNGWRTSVRFFGTTIVLGTALAVLFAEHSFLYGTLAVASGVKLLSELTALRHYEFPVKSALGRSAWLLSNQFAQLFTFRSLSLLLFGVILPLVLLFMHGGPIVIRALIFAVLCVSELTERYLFFRAVSQPKMPGGLS